MAILTNTNYSITTSVVTLAVDVPVQGAPVKVNITAAVSDLMLLAAADNRADWNTQDCCDYAATQIGLPVTTQ